MLLLLHPSVSEKGKRVEKVPFEKNALFVTIMDEQYVKAHITKQNNTGMHCQCTVLIP